jgi:hypothetical protein
MRRVFASAWGPLVARGCREPLAELGPLNSFKRSLLPGSCQKPTSCFGPRTWDAPWKRRPDREGGLAIEDKRELALLIVLVAPAPREIPWRGNILAAITSKPGAAGGTP